MSWNMPKEWKMVTLNDICDKVTDGSHNPPKETETGLPMLSAKNIHDGIIDFQATHRLIPVEQFQTEDRRTSVTTGDILLTIVGALGRVAVVPNDFQKFTLQRSVAVLAAPQIDSNFFGLALKDSSFQSQIFDNAKGTAQKGIYLKKLRELTVMLPPLAEQKVIADKLDEMLAQVESTKARLDAIPAILKSFRQSVLAAAVSGKLTEEWRGNASYLDSEHMEPWGWFGVPTSWDVQLYSELTDSRLGKMLDKGKNTGLPTNYLGNINVRWFDFELSNLQEILVSEKELLELKVQYNDVLICEGGEPGRCAIWKSRNNESIIYQKALHRARVDTKLLPEWLAYNLKNDADSLKLNQLFTGTTIKHLTGKALKRYPIRVPSTEEQTEIVRRVEELFAFADKVESQVNAAQLRVNNLTQSILAKAFRGELTADWRAANPELISGDNSASALLKRIKAEREALAKATQTAKTKPIKNANSRKNT